MGWFRKAEKVVEDALETAKSDAQWALDNFTHIADEVESIVTEFSTVADDAQTQIDALTGRKSDALAHLAHYTQIAQNLRSLFPAPPAAPSASTTSTTPAS